MGSHFHQKIPTSPSCFQRTWARRTPWPDKKRWNILVESRWRHKHSFEDGIDKWRWHGRKQSNIWWSQAPLRQKKNIRTIEKMLIVFDCFISNLWQPGQGRRLKWTGGKGTVPPRKLVTRTNFIWFSTFKHWIFLGDVIFWNYCTLLRNKKRALFIFPAPITPSSSKSAPDACDESWPPQRS